MLSLSLNQDAVEERVYENFLDQCKQIRSHFLAFFGCILFTGAIATTGYVSAHVFIPKYYAQHAYWVVAAFTLMSLFCTGFSLVSVYKVGNIIHKSRVLAVCYAAGMELGMIAVPDMRLNLFVLSIVIFMSSVNALFSMLDAKAKNEAIKQALAERKLAEEKEQRRLARLANSKTSKPRRKKKAIESQEIVLTGENVQATM